MPPGPVLDPDEPMRISRGACAVSPSDAPCGLEHPFREGLRCALHVGHGGPHRCGAVDWASSSLYIFNAP
jgi:hypothetical protein